MAIRKRRFWLALTVATLLAVLMAPIAAQAAPPSPGAGASAPPVVAAPPAYGSAPTTVSAKYGLRLRAGDSVSDPILFVMRNGQTVYPIGGPVWNDGISWTYVGVHRWGQYYEGFCASSYLANYSGYAPTGKSGKKVVAPGGLRLRWGPGTWYSINRVAPYGMILKPTGATQWGSGLSWTQVEIDGLFLWAASMYLVSV